VLCIEGFKTLWKERPESRFITAQLVSYYNVVLSHESPKEDVDRMYLDLHVANT
jgi:hypothetical protein